MKTLNKLKKFNAEENELTEYVLDYLVNEYRNDPDNYFIKDLQTSGCSSGMVSELISYCDTLNFYKKYQYNINELLSEILTDTGVSMSGLFGEKFDTEDPLFLEQNNQNLLAWFGFEQTVNIINDEIEG